MVLRRSSLLPVLTILAACSRRDAAPRDAAPPAPPPSASVEPAPIPVATDVMSNASASWDAGPAVITSGAVDGAALRARNRARLAADRTPVTMLQGGTPRELGERLCKAVVPARSKETPILIKPNLGGFEWFKDPKQAGGDDGVRGRITDPEFVRGIVRCLKARGHDRITIAEGWGAKHKDWERLIDVSGYAAMARAEGVKLVAMDDDGVFDVEGDQPGKPLAVQGMEKTHAPTLLMAKVLAEHLEKGLFISAPKIKAHRFGVTSMAIKGGQGVVMLSDASPAFNQKWRMHKELAKALELLPKDHEAGKKAYLESLDVFAERMTDVLEVASPHVVLAEGAPGMGGDGFGKRWPTPENVAIGGTNPILVDRVGAAFLGLWDNADLAKELGGHKTSPLIEKAAQRFGVDISSPVVEGDGAALLATKRPVHFVSMSGFALHSDGSTAEVASPPSTSGGAGDGGEGKPTLRARQVEEGAITIDGNADAAWQTASAVTFTTDWSGAPAPAATRVRAAWSKRALYMLWAVEDTSVHVDESRPVKTERDKLYEEDCVELFLAPDPAERTRYFEVEVGPLGHFLDLSVDRRTKKSDVAWSSAPEISTRVDRPRRHATIEIALRSPDLVKALKQGAQLPLGLYRMEGKSPRLYLAWSPTRTAKPNFHVPDAFGTLLLE
ncbi:MAG TPA: carbohydrate-binding family 9-like protein [Labilithrix sp.]|nr:carbohydrate-binding family 9-like protein [Labilithrix sp.]